MIFLIDNYTTPNNSQPLYLHNALLKHGKSYTFNISNANIFDVYDTVKPNIIITTAERLNSATILYFQENKHLDLSLILNVDNIKLEDITTLIQYLKKNDIKVQYLFTSNYDIPNNISNINIVKIQNAADTNEVIKLDFDFKIPLGIVVDTLPNDMKHTNSFHVISTNPKLQNVVDICLPCISLRSLYDKYDTIILKNITHISQILFDAVLFGNKVYYDNDENSEHIQKNIEKIFKKDFNLNYNSDNRLNDFTELKQVIMEKHTGYNRAKTILSQIRDVQ